MEGNIDRISALHDALLEHILSFLPTKYAVRTSVLSKRWKYLWLSQTSVSVDGNDLADDDHSIGLDQVQSYILYDDEESNSNGSIWTTKFVNFVDKLLLNRGRGMPIIKKLQLSCREGVRASEFARWLGAILRDGLEELDLEFRIISKKPLSCLVPCNSLVTLKLNVGAFSGHKFPESFYFPNLKTMHLRGFTLANNFTYQLMNCRKLENLILYYFMFDVLLFQDDQIANGNDQQEILPNLNNAWIDCPCAFRGVNSARLFMKNLITVLSKAKLLDLSLSVMEYLYIEPKFPDHMPKFNNLKHLKICLQAYQIGVMSYLLQMTPNLESLHIELYQPYGDHDELMLEHLHSSCSRANLKVIRLSHLNPEDNRQMELVRLFFESAGFLEKIVTELDEIAAMNPSLQCQKLLELPRLSESCVLDVKWDNGTVAPAAMVVSCRRQMASDTDVKSENL